MVAVGLRREDGLGGDDNPCRDAVRVVLIEDDVARLDDAAGWLVKEPVGALVLAVPQENTLE